MISPLYMLTKYRLLQFAHRTVVFSVFKVALHLAHVYKIMCRHWEFQIIL